jgi:hypothetical protein
VFTGELGSWTTRTTPEGVSKDADNATRGTIVIFRDVQSIYVIAPDNPNAGTMVGIVNDAIDRKAMVDVTLDASTGHITDVHRVVAA